MLENTARTAPRLLQLFVFRNRLFFGCFYLLHSCTKSICRQRYVIMFSPRVFVGFKRASDGFRPPSPVVAARRHSVESHMLVPVAHGPEVNRTLKEKRKYRRIINRFQIKLVSIYVYNYCVCVCTSYSKYFRHLWKIHLSFFYFCWGRSTTFCLTPSTRPLVINITTARCCRRVKVTPVLCINDKNY